jgi:hypothetical protein
MLKATPVDIRWHSGLSIYASEAFLKTVSSEYGWIGGVEDGDLVCALPYSVIRKPGFRLIRFPVQTMALTGHLSVESERRFLNAAVEQLRSTGADLIIPATFNTLFRTYPDGAIAAPFGSYVLDLSQPEDVLWSNVHSKHRNVIRNATKKGVQILTGMEHLETAYNLVRTSFMRSAKGFIGRMRVQSRFDYQTFKRQVSAFGENARVFVAEYQGVPQSAAVIPFSQHVAYYMHGGNIPNPLTGSSNLVQWEAIRHFRELGVHYYDFFGARIDPESGSKIEGIMKFKERFGGQLQHGYMWKLSFRPLKASLYSMAAMVRSGGDVVDQERHKLERKLEPAGTDAPPSSRYSQAETGSK